MTELDIRTSILNQAGVFGQAEWMGTRVTKMINRAQKWLQLKLVANKGSRRWKKTVASSASDLTFMGDACSEADLPTDLLYDHPIDFITAGSWTKPAREITLDEWYETIHNGILRPAVNEGVFMIQDDNLIAYPQIVSPAPFTIYYTYIVTDLVYDNDSTDSEIPEEWIHVIIERVVKQIISSLGGEQISQAKQAEIDKELIEKYQLDQIETEDRRDSKL